MKLVERPNNPGTFDWMQGKKIVASITLYDEGLVEFSGGELVVGIERIGRKDQQVAIGDMVVRQGTDGLEAVIPIIN